MLQYMPSAPEDHPNTKFTHQKRNEYLEQLRRGNLKMEAARRVDVSYRTVERRRADDDAFRKEEEHALAEAREGVERVLRDMAMEGDLGAIKMWLTAHDRSTYGDKKHVVIDASPAAVVLSQNDALARIAELQSTLEQRRLALQADDAEIIEVESKKL